MQNSFRICGVSGIFPLSNSGATSLALYPLFLEASFPFLKLHARRHVLFYKHFYELTACVIENWLSTILFFFLFDEMKIVSNIFIVTSSFYTMGKTNFFNFFFSFSTLDRKPLWVLKLFNSPNEWNTLKLPKNVRQLRITENHVGWCSINKFHHFTFHFVRAFLFLFLSIESKKALKLTRMSNFLPTLMVILNSHAIQLNIGSGGIQLECDYLREKERERE